MEIVGRNGTKTVTSSEVAGDKTALDVVLQNAIGGTPANINLAEVGGLPTAVGNGPLTNAVQRVTEAGGIAEGTNSTTAARLNVPNAWTPIFTTSVDRKNQLVFSNLDASNWGELRITASGNPIEMPPNGGGTSLLVDIPGASVIECRAQLASTTLSRVLITVA